MASSSDSRSTNDPYDLEPLPASARPRLPASSLSEIMSGRKRTHWMWYIFPQIDGLAFSSTSKHYSIKSVDEARAYLGTPSSDRGCWNARRRSSASRTDPRRRSSVPPTT